MAKQTYYAAVDLTIERLSIRRGDELGHGDVPPAGEDPGGTFEPVKGLERIEPGHIQAGLETGRIVTGKPAPLAPSEPGGKRGQPAPQAQAQQPDKPSDESPATAPGSNPRGSSGGGGKKGK